MTGGAASMTWRHALQMALTLSLPVIGWLAHSVTRNTEHIAAIQANRFTAEDGLEVWREIAAIREDLARVPREVPPRWLVDRIDGLEEKVNALER